MGKVAIKPLKEKIPVKHYTISTQIFTSLADAKKQIAKFYESNSKFRKDTKIFEVSEVYDVDVQEKVEVNIKKLSKEDLKTK